jgi:serine/threonine protein kinase
LLVPSPLLSTWIEETISAFLAARKPVFGQRPDSLSSSDTQGMIAFFEQGNIRFDGCIKLADFGSGFTSDDGGRRGDLGVRGDVESPKRMEQKNWGLPADVWSVGCTVLELLTGKLLFKMLGELMKKWSDELGLQMLRDTLGSDRTSDDSARSAVRAFLAGEYQRSDVTSHEIGLVEEVAARSIRWSPEARSEITDIRRIWDGEQSFEPIRL